MTHEAELMDLLKEGNDPNPKTSVETNETDSTVGVTHQYDKPEDRVTGESTALQGEEPVTDTPTRTDAVHHSSAVWDESKKVRAGVLLRALDGKATAAKADQAIMSENFKHVASGDFEAHSCLLQGKSKLKVSHARTPTLMERVREVTGRH